MADGNADERWRVVTQPIVSHDAPDLGEAIVARVAAGESLTAVCREAGMPSADTVRAWAAASPGFAEALDGAFRRARITQRLADRRRAAERAARPSRAGGRVSTYTRQLGEAICERLANGESLTAIGRDPALPCYRTMLQWVSRHREFEDMYVEARRIQADFLFDEARDVAQAATPEGVWVSRLQFDVIRWQTARLAPRKYCERLVILEGSAALAAEAAEAAGTAGGMTVIVKRFSDVTPEEVAEAEAYAARTDRRR